MFAIKYTNDKGVHSFLEFSIDSSNDDHCYEISSNGVGIWINEKSVIDTVINFINNDISDRWTKGSFNNPVISEYTVKELKGKIEAVDLSSLLN